VAEVLDEILKDSLWRRTLARQKEDVRSLERELFVSRARWLWSETTVEQRRAVCEAARDPRPYGSLLDAGTDDGGFDGGDGGADGGGDGGVDDPALDWCKRHSSSTGRAFTLQNGVYAFGPVMPCQQLLSTGGAFDFVLPGRLVSGVELSGAITTSSSGAVSGGFCHVF